MTAPAAAAASGPIVAPPPRAAPQAAADRFAFAAVLDSLAGAEAKAGSPAAEEGSRTSNEPGQGEQPSGQPDGHPILGDGAFLSALPFSLPPALAANAGKEAAVDPWSLGPTSIKGSRLENNGASDVASAKPANPAIARLSGERTFHFALKTSGGVSLPTAGQVRTDALSFAPAAAIAEGESGTTQPLALAASSMRGGGPTRDAAPSSPGAAGASLSRADARPSASAAPPGGNAQASSPVARVARKAEAGSPSAPRVASPATASAKSEPSDKAVDGRPPDPAASAGQPAAQSGGFGAQLSASAAAVPSFAPYDAPAATAAIAPRASASVAGPASAAPPVREIDVDLSPSGLEDISMTMRLAGDRLSVVVRAASSQTLSSIEGARDAIADRLAAIGQPLDSLIVKQTGVNADGNTNGNAASADDSSAGGGGRSTRGAGERGGSNDANLSRRGAGRDRSF
jgi:Flagellar hook-length control protein FliK